MSEEIFNPNALKNVVKQALMELVDEKQILLSTDEEARKLAEIMSKEYITVPEAAYLIGCSDSYLYTKITRAEKGLDRDPIPHLDKDKIGVKVLHREKFLAWAQPKKLIAVEAETDTQAA